MSQPKFGSDQLLVRYPGNPILTADNWAYSVNSVFNPGAALLPDGSTILLVRVEDRRGHSHLSAARSKNGIDGWEIDPQPTLFPDVQNFPEELWGIEDPRITFIPELNRYAVVYTSYSRGGPGVSLAMTENFVDFERYGAILPPEDKDAALLPRRINGQWVMIHRPVGSIGAHIWLSYSNDLVHWGGHKMMLEARRGAWWDADKIGLCSPAIETPEGWLIIYHGVRKSCAGCLYRLGLALFDLNHPDVCTKRSDEWVFGPEEPYERFGDVGNVVFPCGFVVDPDGDRLRIYYGAADTYVALANAKISEMLGFLERFGRSYIQRAPHDPSGFDVPYMDHDRRL
jgi:predicted GH43/DUF377 family glycosyl hydrolase